MNITQMTQEFITPEPRLEAECLKQNIARRSPPFSPEKRPGNEREFPRHIGHL